TRCRSFRATRRSMFGNLFTIFLPQFSFSLPNAQLEWFSEQNHRNCFFAGVIRRATQAFAGLRGWHRPRERALARGVNKKHFSGTAEAGALPKTRREWLGPDGRDTRPIRAVRVCAH